MNIMRPFIVAVIFGIFSVGVAFAEQIAPILDLLLWDEKPTAPIAPVVPGDSPRWPISDGYFGVPTTSFTLPRPDPSSGGGLYIIDIQASFPEVNWQTLDRLYIAAGHYRFIRIGNLPTRTSDKPLIITNSGGQVRVGGMGHHYVLALSGGENWIWTGRHDATSGTGNSNYIGHQGGGFANSKDKYGFLLDDDFGNGGSAIRVNFSNKFRIEYVEIREVTFAGMLLKDSNHPNEHMDDCVINDNYIHDIGSEGLYIGATEGQPQHQIRGWKIFNNRVIRTGTEAIQLGQLAGNTEIYNNVFGPAALDWRAAFQPFQDNNFQIGLRAGHLKVHHNIFLGSAGSMMSFFGQFNPDDDVSQNVGVDISDNYFDTMRGLGMYMNEVALMNMRYSFARNSFRNWSFERDEVYNDVASDHLMRIVNAVTPITLTDNVWEAPIKLHSSIPSGNGVSGNKSGSGNTNSDVEMIAFVNSGLPLDFNYRNLEMWADTATLGQGIHSNEPVVYQKGDVVTHLAVAYLCINDPCSAGLVPVENPNVWQPMGTLSDDVRVKSGSKWENYGLQPGLLP